MPPSQDFPGVSLQVEALERKIASLQAEKARLFSYLHELAEVVSVDRGGSRVPELIAEGVAKVVEATGTALYLIDRTGTKLVPKVITKSCPPLVHLPESMLGDSPAGAQARRSFVKLEAVGLDGPVLGACFQSQCAVNLIRLDEAQPLPQGFTAEQAQCAIMVAPLNYGTKKLGVLAAANLPDKGAFPPHIFEVFCSAAEQSAFALGNILLQEEALEKRRLESELRAASEVQRVLLPNCAPQLPCYSISATNVAASIVSGDYYDFIPVDSDHTGVVIADVSGKGIPASLIMTTCRGLLRGLASGIVGPSQAIAKLNRMIYADVKQDMFISMAYVMLDSASGKIVLSRAGHDAPMLYSRGTGSISRLEPPGVALGVDDGDVFDRVTKDYEFEMSPGDCLLLYTDGINEAENANGDQFGLDRLETSFRQSAPNGAEAVLQQVHADVLSHAQGFKQSDDITLIAIQRK